ncbi:methyltransferase [Tsukamurella sp. 1534]|uniref:methyltransferase n=1 Tax=Tsukamurella sp. 1534 TaxID=1151061 RepID=UPI000309B091|nr:methyltransferase [Tsukamurella sp. 1534]
MNLPLLAVKTGAALSRLLHTVADAPVPPEMRVLLTLNRAYEAEVLIALVRLGIPGALADGALTPPDLAERIDADGAALLRLLRVAESIGAVRHDAAGRYRLTAMGDALRDTETGGVAPFVRYSHATSTRRAWTRLTEAVASGLPQFEAANGSTSWQWFADHPDEEKNFAATMRAVCDYNGPALAAAYPWRARSTVCDVGGGVGTLLSHVLARDPSLRGELVDQAGPIAESADFLAARGLTGRVHATVGDFFTPLTVSADVFLLKDVLHDWDDDRATTILRSVRAAMQAGGRLVLFEVLQNPERAHPLVPLVDLTMLVHTDGGRQRTVAEFDGLFAAAGLRRVSVREGQVHSLIEAAAA